MAYIVDYMAHDPVGNVEGQLTCYDAEALAEAEKNGMVFIAVMSDGTRKVVKRRRCRSRVRRARTSCSCSQPT